MNELLAVLAHAVDAEGGDVRFAFDEFPPLEDDLAYVVIPHEYFACTPANGHPSERQLARTIALCVEQPGTQWFQLACAHARRMGAAVDISAEGHGALRSNGIRAERVQLGYSGYWDRWRRDETSERGVDVLFLGSWSPRRNSILAGYGRTLLHRETCFLVPPEDPKPEVRPDFLLGEDKWDLLKSAKTLLNIHRDTAQYFEWVRALESIANGCVLVSEPSSGYEPLVPGEHFLIGEAEDLARLSDDLVEAEGRLREIRLAAYDFIRSDLTMAPTARTFIELGEQLGRRRRRRARRVRPRNIARWVEARTKGAMLGIVARLMEAARISQLLETSYVIAEQLTDMRAALKRLALDDLELKREVAAVSLTLADEDPHELRVVDRSPAYETATPRVSVAIPLYNHAEEVRRALDSVFDSECGELEAVVLDDGSSDGSADAVRSYFHSHPDLPGLLLQHPVNRGLGKTRNVLLEWSRGEFIFALDADNEIYAPAISRLLAALDADEAAVFAYPILEECTAGVPTGLRSCFAWDPERLARGNFIDAMSLLRRYDVRDLGGFTEDIRLHGWEDYDFWCRCAAAGRYGVLVPQILGRYHVSRHSMLSLTNIDDSEMRSVLEARYPVLMGSSSRPLEAGSLSAPPSPLAPDP